MIKNIKGTKDILPNETKLWQYIEKKIHSFLQQYGYLEIRTPKFENTNLQCITAEVKNMHESWAAGQTLANNLKSADLTAIFILSDGLNVNGTQLVNGMKANVSENVIISHGISVI